MRYAPSADPYHDTPSRMDGDDALTGVNAKLSPELVPQGMVTDAINLRFRRNKAETREGFITPASHRWTADTGSHTILGSGVFSDPSGVEWLLLVTPNKVVQVRAGYTPRSVALPEPLTTPCTVVQAFNQVLIFRNANAALAAASATDIQPWVWDGGINTAFVVVNQDQLNNTTSPIPNGPNTQGLQAVLMNNRLIIPYNQYQLAFSDLLDYTRYDATLADFNVNQGSEDTMVGIFPFTNNTLLVLMTNSVYAIGGVTADLGGVSLDQITRDVGCIAGRSAAMVGGDVFWLSSRGVFRLQQLIQSRLQTAALPVSDPIQPIIDRINWPYAGAACAAVHRDYYSLAVPLDGSTVNNAILPYNTVTQAWEGIHTFPAGVQIDNLHIADYFGSKQLWAVDCAAGLAYLMYYGGRGDRVNETPSPIPTSLTTRGFRLGDNGIQDWKRAQFGVETINPALTFTATPEGQNRAVTLARNLTKSRTAYYTFNTAPWVANNPNDDWAAPGRQDYRVATPFQVRSGIQFDATQAVLERRPVRTRGRYLTLTVANATGYCAVTSLQAEGDETDRALRTQV